VWQRTRYGSLAHARPGGKGDTALCPHYQGDPVGPAPVDMPRCHDCNHWAAGVTFASFGWVTPTIVVDGAALAAHATDCLRTQAALVGVAINPANVRHWTLDEDPRFPSPPAERAMFEQGWRRLRAEVHVPREAM
jgi:hypothetical protein